MRTMHLFAGAGGGLLADLILGHTPIVAVEWDKYACNVLRERATDGWFPELRVWEGDVREFYPAEYAGVVDCIHAGFPCQDISNAGSQAGIGSDTRSGLYREVLRIASIVRPRIIFLENVAAITSKSKDYLEVIAKDLAEIGYNAQWLCLSAADVGANHKRERWWCMARMADTEINRTWKNNGRLWQRSCGVCGRKNADAKMGNTEHPRCTKCGCRTYKAVADTSNTGRKEQHASAITSGAGQHTRCNDSQRAERPAQPGLGWMADGMADRMDASWWETEPDIPRVSNGISSRVNRLKALGNGQVPLQAAVAFRMLEELL